MTLFQHWLVVGSVLLLLSVLASRASGKLGVPALLLFLMIGVMAGPQGPGHIQFDDPQTAQSIGIVALMLGVFAGGLETDWNTVRPVLRDGLALSTLGVFLTTALVGYFASLILHVPLLEGLLLGAIVSSTDAPTVFEMLRPERMGLRGRLKPLLELESGSNDPMTLFLTTGLIYLLTHPGTPVTNLVPQLAAQVTIGAALGLLMGKVTLELVNHLQLEHEGLYPVLTVSLVMFTFGATASLGGNGILAIYLAGLVIGNSDFIHKRSLVRFHHGLAWLMQIAMFLTLGLLVVPSRIAAIWPAGCLVALFLILIARPAAVFLTLQLSGLNRREKAMVAWVGLRGATPIILATFPLLAGLPRANLIFDLVFFVVTTSVLLKGISLPMVSRLLGVDAPPTSKRQYPLEFVRSHGMKTDLMEVPIPHDSVAVGKQIVELGLPKGALVVLIGRGKEFMIPSGGTVLEREDSMLVLADKESLRETKKRLQAKPHETHPVQP